jgi:hypothetical protein
MMKSLLASSLLAIAVAGPARGEDAAPPPVESMTCAQMQAELMLAGQRMNSQLDPEFAAEARRMEEERRSAYADAQARTAAGVGMGLACSAPGAGMACQAAQAAEAADAARAAQENQARMNAQHERLQDSMAGLDQARLMALSQRFEAERCATPD